MKYKNNINKIKKEKIPTILISTLSTTIIIKKI